MRTTRLTLCLIVLAGCENPAPPVEDPKPLVTPVSATGHDRFFGLTYDPSGAFYTVGQVSDGTDNMAGDFRLVVAKFTAEGKLDTSFGSGGFATHNVTTGMAGQGAENARTIVVQSSGKVVVTATVQHAGAADPRDRDVALVRFNQNGTVDNTFGTGGVATLDLSTGELAGMTFVADSAWGMARYSDDRLVVMGAAKRMGATDTDFALARLSADGQLDPGFGTAGVFTLDINNRSASPRMPVILSDGSLLGTGYYDDGGVVKPVVFKVDASGKLDTSYGTGGYFSQPVLAAVTEIYAVALQGSSLVTAGYGRDTGASEGTDWVSLRITASGTLDTTWGKNGVVRMDVAGFADNARNLTALPDGRFMIVGGGRPTADNVDAACLMLTSNGQPDETFAPAGRKLVDLGGPADMFWGAAVNPAKTHLSIAGVKGAAMGANDDSAILLIPLPK